MTINSFLIIQKGTGIPIYTKDFQADQDTQNIIFSGFMTVIQSLMNEMMLGSLQKISTDKYQIYGEEKEKYVFFLIGNIDNQEFVAEFLDYIGTYLDYYPMNNALEQLPDEVIKYLDEMTDHLYLIYSRSDFVNGVFQYSETEGLIQLTDSMSSENEFFITNYISNLSKKQRQTSHIFYLVAPNKTNLIGMTKTYNEKKSLIILSIKFSDNSLLRYASFKQQFVKIGFEFIDNYSIKLFDPNLDKFNKELIAENLSIELERTFNNYVPSTDFIGANHLLNAISSTLIEGISTIMLGKPLAILSDDKEIAKELINFLVFITGITDASLELNPDLPKRITLCPREFKSLFKDLRYAFLDFDNIKLEHGVKSNYLYKKWSEIQNSGNEYFLKIDQLRQECQNIWEECRKLILQNSKGADCMVLIGNMENEKKDIIQKVVKWVYPQMLAGNLAEISETKVNW